MKKHLTLFFTFLMLGVSAMADDFPYGIFNLKDLELKSYEKDNTAHAVVLQEYGTSRISYGDEITLTHEYHVKIKIFDSKGFDKGNVEIQLRKNDANSFEKIRNIEAITYYTDESGNVKQSTLGAKQIFTENANKYRDVVKFAMPNLHEGCVIEYKYTIESPYLFNFKQWDFQWDIPKVTSEYVAYIPAFYSYNVSLRGFNKLTKSDGRVERDCFKLAGNNCDCSALTYLMNDIPAFKEEDYMTSPKNFLSAMYFEMTNYTDFNNGAKKKITQEWVDVDRELRSNEEFGMQMRKTYLFANKLPGLLAGKNTSLDKAKAIYAYIQKSIKLNNFYGLYTDVGIKKALESHNGNVADINLALLCALNAAGLDAEAVLLSTREHGLLGKLYPVLSEFNYVVAKVNIDDKSYLLDATDPDLPFGLLPLHCINDQGRVINAKKPSYWIDLQASQKKMSTYVMDLSLQSNGKFKGVLKRFSNGYEAYNLRKAIKKFNSTEEYIENLDEKLSRVKILKSEITGIDSLDKPLGETYEIEMDGYDNTNSKRIAFNPYLFNKLTENPFKLSERNYPVDWGAPSETRYILTLHMPEDYTVESSSPDVGFKLPNGGGMFATSLNAVGNTYSISNIVQLNKSVYSSDEYLYLKELFNKIILTEKADIIFKKKS
jgi:transglutaminase-like putative cysteine protease